MKIKKSQLDKYVMQKEALINKREKIQDNGRETNADIDAQIKSLRNLQKQNAADTRNELKIIDRDIDKLTRLINVEKDYAKSIENK